MKKLFQLAPALLFLAACQSDPKAAPTDAVAMEAAKQEPAKADPPQPEPPKAEPANLERVQYGTLTVNGKPQEELTTKELIRQLGRPDSIAKGAVECGSELSSLSMNSPDPDVWYYGKTGYEVSGKRAIMCCFNVTSGKFQGKLGKLLLNQNTTLEDIRRVYPMSAKEADKPRAGQPDEEMMSLPFYDKDQPLEAGLILLFKQGRLEQVDFWSPC